jgi:hypothetical protein
MKAEKPHAKAAKDAKGEKEICFSILFTSGFASFAAFA